MASSLLFCMRKAHLEVQRVRGRVEGSMARNEQGRLRVAELRIQPGPELTVGDAARAARCPELFEGYCVVGQSVRSGVDVTVQVEPTAALRTRIARPHRSMPSPAARCGGSETGILPRIGASPRSARAAARWLAASALHARR